MFGISDMPTHCGTSRHELKIGSVKKARNTTSFAEEMLPFKGTVQCSQSHARSVVAKDFPRLQAIDFRLAANLEIIIDYTI